MIDLDQLRRTIANTPGPGEAATVTRGFLMEVLAEITEGRVAIANLARERCMADVVQSLTGDPQS